MAMNYSIATLSTNLGVSPSLKLKSDNMLFWKALMFPRLRCAGVFGLLGHGCSSGQGDRDRG